MPLLEKIDERIIAEHHIEKVHLWVDQKPSSQVHSDECDDSDSDSGRFSKSKKKKGPSKKQTTDDSPSIKKTHPRSHEAHGKDEDTDDDLLLCRKYFFTGECDGFKNGGKLKKSSYQCDLVHFPKHHSTLFDVLNSRSSKRGYCRSTALEYDTAQVNVLKKASNAATVAQMKLEDIEEDQIVVNDEMFAMDMMYHLEYNVSRKEPNLSRLIASVLSREKVPVGSIGYLVLNNDLIFDRYDGGNVMSMDLQREILKEDENELTDESHEGACNDIVQFPSAVLEMIITFLPNNYSGIMPTICKVWHQEIGCHSPALWRNLNTRNRWPNPNAENLTSNESDSVVHAYKDMFVSNYKASLRIGNLLEAGNSASENVKSDNNAVATGSIPTLENGLFSDFRFFSETSAIIGTESGCIYMVQTYKEKNQLFSKTIFGPIRIVPKPHSKRSDCKLMNFEIDEQYVIFSFEVDSHSGMLTSISKENLLAYSSETVIECGDDNVMRYHDLSKGFREFYQDCGYEEFDFIRDFTERFPQHQVHVRLNDHNLTLCGYGTFVALCEIFTCTDYDDEEDTTTVHGMGLISFSVNSKSFSIIDFYLFDSVRDSPYGLTSNYHLKKKSDQTIIIEKETGKCFFIDRKGLFDKSASKSRTLTVSGQHFLLSSTYGVSANLIESHRSNFSYEVAITLDLFESETGVRKKFIKTVYLTRCYSAIIDMIFLGNNHILVVCRYEHPEDEREDRANEGFDGQWFGIDDVHAGVENDHYDFIVVQIPTLMVIDVQTVHLSKACLFLLQSIPKLGTIAMISPGLFRITGIKESSLMLEDEGDEKNDNSGKTKKEKKKKKRLASKTEKKDGFARGMNFW